jgi:hypothetical protein
MGGGGGGGGGTAAARRLGASGRRLSGVVWQCYMLAVPWLRALKEPVCRGSVLLSEEEPARRVSRRVIITRIVSNSDTSGVIEYN